MEETLLIGDHLIVDKASYTPPDTLAGDLLPHREIERRAIVVFRFPLNLQDSYIKRVIGLPGKFFALGVATTRPRFAEPLGKDPNARSLGKSSSPKSSWEPFHDHQVLLSRVVHDVE